jgi:ADP-heptose:LPS heptosyltransferase
VLRCIKQQNKNVELHYITKNSFSSVLKNNPFIDKLHTFEKDVMEIITKLKDENFDLVVDLHHNLRSLRLKRKLGKKSTAFNKIN